MFQSLPFWLQLVLAAAVSFAVCFLVTPSVKRFAERAGVMDVPKDERRVHNHPIPRMGGLAIFIGFLVSVLIFAQLGQRTMGLLVGTLIIVVMGAVDDIVNLKPWIKLAVQIVAAIVAIRCGICFTAISNLNVFSATHHINIGWLSVPLTLLWIVGCTNAVNLIDGLDGLAVGVSAISSITMLAVSLFVSSPAVAILLAAVTGACLGFIPYNFNPAKIFMGDVGSQMLGYVLSVIAIMGQLKLHSLITFVVPVLAMAVPLADTIFAFFRRILHGQSPFKADRGHFHHRLLALGLNQKQAVAVLYSVSAILGLFAVLLSSRTLVVKVLCPALAFIIGLGIWFILLHRNKAAAAKAKASENDAEAAKEEPKA